MPQLLAAQAAARDEMLARIVTALQNDDRFLAAWLAGSFGRGEQDELSDIDLRVAVTDDASERLCARPWPQGARTTDERLALFRQFGEPALVYDAHQNAPEGGVFTYVLYQENALNVDWIFVPQAIARRGEQTRLLFDKAGIPMEELPAPPSLEERAAQASVQVGFFWVMTPIAIKYMLREKPAAFQDFLEGLHGTVEEIKGLIAGKTVPYHSGAAARLCLNQVERVAAVRVLCESVLELMPAVERMGGYVPADPMSVVNIWLAMDGYPERQKAYAANREAVRARMVDMFQADERVVAMWLSGSYARGEQDDLSDLDVRLVVADTFADRLCQVVSESAVPRVAAERIALVSQFGEPGIVWESPSWVGEGSCFTLTHYRKSGLHVDWVFVPEATARLERESTILFDKTGILAERLPQAESQEQRATSPSDIVGSFWMIAAESIKYLARGDLAWFYILLHWLQNMLNDVSRLLEQKPVQNDVQLALTRGEQVATLRDLCRQVLALMPEVTRLGGYVPASPMVAIEKRLAIAEETA